MYVCYSVIYIRNNAIVITTTYVYAILLSHVTIHRYAKIVVRIVLVSVVRLHYNHSTIVLQ